MGDIASNGEALKTSGSKRRNKKSGATNVLDAPNLSKADSAAPLAEAETSIDGDDKAYDSPHIRDIQKNMRNVAKKLAGTQKVDSIILEHPNVSLDELVAQRKINADQRAQALKKPALQAQLAQLEEQLALHKKIEDGFQDRLRAERERLEAAHKKELEAVQQQVTTPPKAAEPTDDFREKLLVLSKFLRAAAARRTMDDETSEDSMAFEGLLLLVYGGDSAAADAAERLIQGASTAIPSTEGDLLTVTYERVKQMSLEYVPPFTAEEAWVNGVAEAQTEEEPATDPTIANAGLNEAKGAMSAGAVQAGGPVDSTPAPPAAPQQAATGEAAANTVANDKWDVAADGMESSWVSVPRAPDETEQAPVSASSNAVQNWADEQPVDSLPVAAPQADPTDGFHEVHHGRGRGRGGGQQEQRGRGRGGHRGDGRGRGFRGDRGGFRGRGRGGPRGGRGGEAAAA